MIALLHAEFAPRIPADHMASIRKLIRCANDYRMTCAVLATCEDDMRAFRSLQQADRINRAESNMNRAREALDAAIDEMRAFTA